MPAFRDSLPEADLFAGFADATIQKENATLVNIELKRKVAGVQVYLKNIPYEINHSGMNYQVKSVRVSLYDDQRTSIKLWAGDPTSGENPGSRFGSGILTDSRELINIPMTDAQGVPYPKSGDGNFYAIPEQKEPFAKLANTVYGGVFLLPIAEPASTATNTLLIELWADPSSDLQDKRLKTYVVNLKKDGGTLSGCYPLEGNHLYSVGKKYSAESTVDDKPVDLLGNAIEIEVQDYEFVSCDFDFPTIDMYPPTIVPSFGQHYIFDCIHTEETIDIYAPYPYDGLTWTLTVHDTCDWIHIINDQNEYTDHFSSQGTRKVKLLINDYVKPQKESMSFEERLNDMRSATLQLETRQGDWKYVSKLEIKQDNAFMIRSKHSWGVVSTGDFGISRLDYGANFRAGTTIK